MKLLNDLALPLRERTIGQLLARHAARQGEKAYLLYEDERYSYRDTDRVTNRLANALIALGVTRGTIVALLCDNTPEALFLYFALGKIGAIAAPINTAAAGEQVGYFINAFDAATLVVEPHLAAGCTGLAAACPKLRSIVLLDARPHPGPLPELGLPIRSYRRMLEAPDTPSGIEVRFRDLAHIPYTSGTTGVSKGNLQTHCGLLSGAIAYVEYMGYRESDVLYACLPIFHMSAYGNCLQALAAGATIALARRFSASRFWVDIRRFGATQFTSVGAMSNFLWSQPALPEDADNPVRLCNMIPVPGFGRDFERRFGLKIVTCYGMSDFGPLTFLPPDHPPEKWGSAGQIRRDMQLAILDGDDLPLPAGAVGEIAVRATEPWVAALGYYGMAEETVASRRNFWFHTGDYGHLDSEGYLFFDGRKKDAIRRRGENVSAFEVEQVILRHPAVADVAAYAVPSEHSEDEIMVSIVPVHAAAIAPAELIGFCRERMAYYMVPRYVEVAAALPKTETQKVDKVTLRASAANRLHEVWDRDRHGIVLRASDRRTEGTS